MCGRFVMLTMEEVVDAVAAVEGRMRPSRLVGSNREQARPGSTIPLFGWSSDMAGQLAIGEAIWGFRESWSDKPLFNTRIESALRGSHTWRAAIADGRCIVPAAAYFEPHRTETMRSPRTGRPVKRSYEFASAQGMPLLLAGVQEGGRCSIVTCEPSEQVSPIHPRMPLALRFEEVETWLSPDWPSLADHAAVELTVRPEHPDAPEDSGQLSLF